jgi:hypothetical protein
MSFGALKKAKMSRIDDADSIGSAENADIVTRAPLFTYFWDDEGRDVEMWRADMPVMGVFIP